MRKKLILVVGVVVILVLITAIWLTYLNETDCCAIDPDLGLSQAEAEYYVAAKIPADAENIYYRGEAIDRDKGTSEAYVSFDLDPARLDTFIATIPNLSPLKPGFNPFDDRSEFIENFGGEPTTYEGATYDLPFCDRAIMVDKSDETMYHVYLYAWCGG